MIRKAHFEEFDGHKHRLLLTRSWRDNRPNVVIIGLNPSTANGVTDDNTIKRIIGIADYNGYGSFHMLNLFTLVSSKPSDLLKYPPLHPDTDKWVGIAKHSSNDVIFMWGDIVRQLKSVGERRVQDILHIFKNHRQFVFALTVKGYPWHPLLLPKKTKLIELKP